MQLFKWQIWNSNLGQLDSSGYHAACPRLLKQPPNQLVCLTDVAVPKQPFKIVILLFYYYQVIYIIDISNFQPSLSLNLSVITFMRVIQSLIPVITFMRMIQSLIQSLIPSKSFQRCRIGVKYRDIIGVRSRSRLLAKMPAFFSKRNEVSVGKRLVSVLEQEICRVNYTKQEMTYQRLSGSKGFRG